MKYSALLALVFAASAFADEAAPAEQQGGSMFMGLLPFILMFVVMYLFFIMPKQKEMKKLDAMRKALKKGDQVLTTAGIIGSVMNIEGNIVTVKTGNDTKLDFEQAAILRVLNANADDKKSGKIMAVLEIKVYGNPVLREKCKPVDTVTPELVALAHDMLDTMYEAGGVGLAAPQVGKDVRLVVIDPARPDENETPAPRIIFNPTWGTEPDSENVPYDEGCLSVPDVFCNVYRPGKIWIRYTDENGQTVEERNVEGLLCRCFQHESDHLDGKLFVDVISTADREINRSRLRDMVKKEKKKLESKKTGKR